MAFIGMRHPVVATLSAHTAGSEPTYAAGKVVGHAIAGNLTITRNSNPLYGDDTIVEDDNSITAMSLELGVELCGLCPKEAMHFVGESAELAMAAIRSARLYIVDMSDYCSDDTYRFVIRRENEITLEQCEKKAAAIRDAAEKAV